MTGFLPGRFATFAQACNRVHDARIFGVRADGGMILSLISLAVTFYVFVFFWLFGIDAGR